MELHDILIMQGEGFEFRHSHIGVVFGAIAGPGHTDVTGTGQRPGDLDQAGPADFAGIEFVEGRLADQACGGDAHAPVSHEDDVTVLELDFGQIPVGQEVIEVDVGHDALAALDHDVAEAAAFGSDTAGPVQIIEDGILLPARITAGIEHMPCHEDGHGLGTHQIGVDLDVGSEDRGDLVLDGALQLGVAEPAHADGTNFGHEDVALLIDDKDVVIGEGTPGAQHDAVTGRDDVLGLQAFLVRIGKVAPEQAGPVRQKTFYERRRIGGLGPGRGGLQRHRLAQRGPVRSCLLSVIHCIAGGFSVLGIHGIHILHAGARCLDARGRRNSITITAIGGCLLFFAHTVRKSSHQGLLSDSVCGISLGTGRHDKKRRKHDSAGQRQIFHQNPACSRMAATIRETRPSSTAAASMNTRLKTMGRG